MRTDGVLMRARLSRAPVEDEVRRVRAACVAVEDGRGDEDPRDSRRRGALERDAFDAVEALVLLRLFELAGGAHLGGGRVQARLAGRAQLLRARKRSEAVEQSFDHVHLSL